MTAALLAVALSGCTPGSHDPAPGSAAASTAPRPAAPQLAPAGVSDMIRAVVACMSDRGWTGHASADSITWETLPSSQRDQFKADHEACDEESAHLMPEPAPLTEALLLLNYQRAEAAAACYDTNGFAHEDLPSYQQFKERFYADDPYITSFVLHTTRAPEFDTAQRTCPEPYDFFFDPTTRLYAEDVDYAAYERTAP